MFIAEQMTETLLRELVAQWVRTALGELVEDRGEQKEGHYAYTCS